MNDKKQRGIAYGVGVGPGDPEMMTLKACRLIRENDVIAVPGKVPQDAVAYKVAVRAVPVIEAAAAAAMTELMKEAGKL